MRLIDADECEKYFYDHMTDAAMAAAMNAIAEMPTIEPCEDCVSRQAVLEYIEGSEAELGHSSENELVCQYFKELPPVTPKPKTAHWIETLAEDACGELYSYWTCSECGRSVGYNLANIEDVLEEYPYCHCGAKMKGTRK